MHISITVLSCMIVRAAASFQQTVDVDNLRELVALSTLFLSVNPLVARRDEAHSAKVAMEESLERKKRERIKERRYPSDIGFFGRETLSLAEQSVARSYADEDASQSGDLFSSFESDMVLQDALLWRFGEFFAPEQELQGGLAACKNKEEVAAAISKCLEAGGRRDSPTINSAIELSKRFDRDEYVTSEQELQIGLRTCTSSGQVFAAISKCVEAGGRQDSPAVTAARELMKRLDMVDGNAHDSNGEEEEEEEKVEDDQDDDREEEQAYRERKLQMLIKKKMVLNLQSDAFTGVGVISELLSERNAHKFISPYAKAWAHYSE